MTVASTPGTECVSRVAVLEGERREVAHTVTSQG